jgi:hypothetical protein
MFRSVKLNTLVATGLGVVALAIAPAALADVTSSTDGNIAVTTSLACTSATCIDSEHATAGDVVTAAGSVTNMTPFRLKTLVNVTLSLVDSTNTTVYSVTKHLNLASGQMYADSASFVVQSGTPAGVYTLLITANGVSSAATITIS